MSDPSYGFILRKLAISGLKNRFSVVTVKKKILEIQKKKI